MPSSISLWIFVLTTIIDSMNCEVFPEYMDIKIKFDVAADLEVNDLEGLQYFVHEISTRIPILNNDDYEEKAKLCVEFTDFAVDDWSVAANVNRDTNLQSAENVLRKIEDHRQNKRTEKCENSNRPGVHQVFIIVKRDQQDAEDRGKWRDALSPTYLQPGVTAAVVANTFNENSPFNRSNNFACVIEMIDQPTEKHMIKATSMQEGSVELAKELWNKIKAGFSNCDYDAHQIPPCRYARRGECVMEKLVALIADWMNACGGNSTRFIKCQDRAECDGTCERGFQDRPCSRESGQCVKTLPTDDRLLENCKDKTQVCNRTECPEESTQASTTTPVVSTTSEHASTSASTSAAVTTTSSTETEHPSTSAAPAEESIYKKIGKHLAFVGFLIGYMSGYIWILFYKDLNQVVIEVQSTGGKSSSEKIDVKVINKKIDLKSINKKVGLKLINKKISLKLINKKISLKLINEKIDGGEANAAKGDELKRCIARTTKTKTAGIKGKKKTKQPLKKC